MGIEGISHITIIVHDLDRMKKFFCEGLGAVGSPSCRSSSLPARHFIDSARESWLELCYFVS
jgi:extradiol dioxygenase family protein